jgi:hypothetical protein
MVSSDFSSHVTQRAASFVQMIGEAFPANDSPGFFSSFGETYDTPVLV